ncbi:MAG: hypothetical protein BWY22_00485 [Bacteroidetes bacterium ADurb.Bin217]|nr:MAG: hypothetical protein BWY22_00485 [Bacteroidetes bacterium ADurb.Bin217]
MSMKQVLTLACFLAFQITLYAQNYESILTSFEQGDVDKLSTYFDENIDLTVLQNEGIYSKAQSKVILKNFFAANTPAKFTMQHQGGGEQSKYIIGKLVSNDKSYRVYFLFKKSNETRVIQKIRIEHDK